MTEDSSLFDGIAAIVPTLLAIVDLSTTRIIDMNDYGLDLLGYSRAEIVGMDYRSLVHEVDHRPDQVGAVQTESPIMLERRLRHAAGHFVNYSLSARPHPDRETVVLLAGRPLDDMAFADSSLGDLLQLSELTPDPFLVCDKQGFVRYANTAAQTLHNSQSIGSHLTDFLHESDVGYPKLLEAYWNDEHRASARIAAVDSDGTPLMLSAQTVYDPNTECWFTVERDISDLVAQEERLAKLTLELKHRATTDDLTGVANRSALNELIEDAIADETSFVLLLLDMDDFKSVNDTLGHAAGDELLMIVAQRLSNIVGDDGTVGRLGGDEFVLFVPGIDASVGALIASRVIESIGAPFVISGATLSRSCSIGVAASQAGDTVSTVLRRADQAAYQAKHAGRSRFQVHGGSGQGWPSGRTPASTGVRR